MQQNWNKEKRGKETKRAVRTVSVTPFDLPFFRFLAELDISFFTRKLFFLPQLLVRPGTKLPLGIWISHNSKRVFKAAFLMIVVNSDKLCLELGSLKEGIQMVLNYKIVTQFKTI